MKVVAKYNVFKGISTALTIGTPFVTLMSCSEFFVTRSETAVSAAGVFTFLFALLFLKDKILENFKIPSPFVISLIGLILIVVIESIIYPIKIVFLTTCLVTCVDTFTFRAIYKQMELNFTDDVKKFKKFGFIFGRSKDIIGD